VRTPEEYAAGHLPGFGSAPGGQLVQETDVHAAVRGARIALADGGPTDDGVRAAMTAHWLAQLGWEVGWLTDNLPTQHTESGPWRPAQAPLPELPLLSPAALAQALQAGRTVVLDVGTSAQHVRGHVPGAGWVLRTDLARQADRLPAADRIVLCCSDGRLSRLAAADLAALTTTSVAVLDGGTTAWVAAGLPLESGERWLLSPRIDRYRRPYEGTDAPREAMQGYLDWEFGLVAQLARDGTHGFKVLAAA
jgi:rhodanese-related sulfurtransferase